MLCDITTSKANQEPGHLWISKVDNTVWLLRSGGGSECSRIITLRNKMDICKYPEGDILGGGGWIACSEKCLEI